MSDPGNTLATAQVIAIGATSQPFENTVSTANPEDYYRFTLSGRSSVNLSLTGLNGNADLQLLNDAGTVLQASTNTGTTAEIVNLTDLSAGVYYVRVFAASGTTSAQYTFAPQASSNVQTDILWRNYSTGQNTAWTMNGTTRVSSTDIRTIADLNWRLEESADFSGDGQTDLLWRNYSTGQNVIWLMNGTTSLSEVFLQPVGDVNWHLSGTGDFNSDGQTDLLWRNYSTGQNVVWLMNGTTFSTDIDLLRPVSDPNWQINGTGDFNHDGQTDILWRRYDGTGENVVWLMNGTTFSTAVALQTVGDPNWRISGTGDFNSDGQTDILWRRYSTGENVVWLMNGTTLLSGAGVNFAPISDLNWQIAASFVHYSAPGVADTAGNTTATAFDIGTFTGQATYRGAVNGSDTNDYYRFTLPVAAPNFVLALKGLTGDADLQLLDSNGNSLQASSNSGTTAELIQLALTAGNYYLRVLPATSSASANYTLGLSFDAAPPTVTVGLANDTASSGTNTDGRTADPTITAQIGTERTLGHLRAGFNNTLVANYTDVAVPLQAGSVTLSPTQLQAINGGLPLTDGVYVLHLRATGTDDVLVTTTDLTFTLDTTTSAPSDLYLTTGTGNTTNVTTPTVTGQAEVGAVVKVYGAGNVLLGQGVTDSNGSWQATLSPLTDGTYQVTAIATDVAGNVSAASTVLSLVVDTQAPTAPSNLSLVPAGMYAVAITGTAEAGAQVQLFAGTTLIGEAVANATGSWRVTTSQLRNGTHSLTATASDAAGNTSPATTATDVTITTLVPSTPQGLRLTALTDSGQSASDNITNNATPTVVGTTEAGATVRLFRAQQLLGETTADATTGAWSIALTTALQEGEQSLSVVAHNAIGDSQTATLLTTIDTVAPTTTQLNVLATGSTTATALANGMTLTTGTRLLGQVNGTTSAVVSLQYQLGTSPAVTVPVATNGLFNYRLDLTGSSSGDDQMLTVTMTDVAGNTTTLAPFLVNVSATNDGGGEAPVLLAQLMQDTGSGASDGWTYIPGIAGVASAPGVITALLATFDTATDAVFQDLSDLLQPDGTFVLDEEILVALAGGDLADGAYTLRLRVQADTNQIAEQVVSLTLDRTAPVTTLPNLMDGIAWERNTPLQGTVVEASAGVEVAYQLETINGVSVGSTHALAVTDQAFNQVLDAATLTEEIPYHLVLTSTDRAGNSQRSRFQFFIPSARQVLDDDMLPSMNQSDPTLGGVPSVTNISTWGYVGSGGWGSWNGSSFATNEGVGFDSPNSPANTGYTGSGYEYTYTESITRLVDQAVNLISNDRSTATKKAALSHREDILRTLGQRLDMLIQVDQDFTNDQGLIDRMRPAIEGLFASAYDPEGLTAGIRPGFVLSGGAWLAQSLVSDPLSVRVQVFQATLLEVVTEATLGVTDIAKQEALTAAVMALAKTYAWLNPNPEATVPAGEQDFDFLDALWRLQIPNAITGAFKGSGDIAQTLEESVAALGRLLEGVEDPVRAIQFLNNLVQAASNITSLKADVQGATFLRELMEFGVEFVQTNPRVNPTATDAAVQGFLDRLWRGDTQQVKQSQRGLNAFFVGMETAAERIKGLEFADNLLDAAALLQGAGLETQKHDPTFLDALVGIGGAYAALDPQTSAAGAEEPQLFLNTLWQTQNFQKGVEELEDFLIDFDTSDERLSLLRFQQRTLHTLRQISSLQEDLSDVWFTNAMLTSGSTYAYTQLNQNAEVVFNDQLGFFENIWFTQNNQIANSTAVGILSNVIAQIPDNNYDSTWEVASGSTTIASNPFVFQVTKPRFDTFVQAEELDLDSAGNPLNVSAYNKRAGEVFETFAASNLGLILNKTPATRLTATREGINFVPDIIGAIEDKQLINGVLKTITYNASELFEIKAQKSSIDISDKQILGYISYLGHNSSVARAQQGVSRSERLLPILNFITTTDLTPGTPIISRRLVLLATVNGVIVKHSVLLTDEKTGVPLNPRTANYLKLSNFRLLNPVLALNGRYPEAKLSTGRTGSLFRPRGGFVA